MYIIKHLHLTIKRKNTMQDKESLNGSRSKDTCS